MLSDIFGLHPFAPSLLLLFSQCPCYSSLKASGPNPETEASLEASKVGCTPIPLACTLLSSGRALTVASRTQMGPSRVAAGAEGMQFLCSGLAQCACFAEFLSIT